MREFNNVAELADCVGEEIGVSDWFSIDQDRINDFAEGADVARQENSLNVNRYIDKESDIKSVWKESNTDKVYNVHFYAYAKPTELSSYDDTIVLPDQYASVVLARIRYYVHQFKENLQQAAFALDDYKKGMKSMKSNLINPQPKSMTDDRIYF